ncbi:hypothetical protein PM082_014341 [Marasmius tenuissimus]|nr:hypothetical protein PM082_014341 [Marasmius tenuissimus]
MLTIDKLSAELLGEILKDIHDSSRHTIFSLLQVNKYISDAALPFVYRQLSFDFDFDQLRQCRYPDSGEEPYTRTLQKIHSLLKLPPNSAVWKGVRTITVRSRSVIRPRPWERPNTGRRRDARDPPFVPSEESVQERWGSFIEFLSRIINLRELVFDCAERVPVILLRHLEDKHPYCALHVRNWTRLRFDTKFGDTYEEALARSPCLRSIEAGFVDGVPQMDFTGAAFDRILALSPNLEEFSLTCRATGGYGHVYGFTGEQMIEKEKEKERFKVAKPVRKDSVKKVKWQSLSSGLFQRWEAFFDLRNVETIDLGVISDTGAVEYATDNGFFSGLKHLSFKIVHFFSDDESQERLKLSLESFLCSLSALESLSIVNYHGYINLPLLLRHRGKLLRSLSLHQVESAHSPRPILTQSDMELIRSDAPHLEHLELDFNRTSEPKTNEFHTHEVVSSFPNLRSLVLHYDLGLRFAYLQEYRRTETSDRDFYREVYTKPDRDFVVGVWRAVAHGGQFERMSLYFGEPDRAVGLGYLYSSISAEQQYRQQIHVSRNERDDLKDDVAALQIVVCGRSADLLLLDN